MRLLLDTHTFLWWVGNAPALSEMARAAIADGDNECFLSMASCWEMAIKCGIGKMALAQPVKTFIPEQLAANGFRLLNIEFRHVAGVESLAFHHRDPFDRLLVVQALSEGMVLVSADATLSRYGVTRLW